MNTWMKDPIERRQFITNAAKTLLGVSALPVGVTPDRRLLPEAKPNVLFISTWLEE